MKVIPQPQNEEQRLAALREYDLLDTPPESAYDAFARVAAGIAGVPISLISLIDRDRQWFKARVGLQVESTPRDQSFCAHTIGQNEPFIVPDAAADDRFCGNPLVTGAPSIRFYAGFPLRSPDGHGLGALCVIDRRPRSLSPTQEQALRDLSSALCGVLEERRETIAEHALLTNEIEEQRNSVLELNQVKSDLIAMLAHDFKGPLTNILGYADLTAEMGDLNEHQLQYLESIRSAALRLSALASDTLALSRLERNEIDLSNEVVDLGDLLREVIDAGDSQAIDLDVRDESVVQGDVRRLRQVFYNLVENAVKYSPGGQAVSVRVFRSGDRAIVEVADRGIGIPSKDMARVFDRFARASNARKMRITGTGFGLFLAHQIVELHGGRIELESTENEGSTFRVVLPLSVRDHLARALRVAVLERRRESRSFIVHALRQAGLRARLVPSVEALLQSDIFKTDRIVVDLDAVPLEGAQRKAIEQFARDRAALLIVVGSDPPAFRNGTHVLRKPYLLRELVSAVQAGAPTRSGAE